MSKIPQDDIYAVAEARAEAERLCKKEQETFLIMKEVARCEIAPQVKWTEEEK